MLTVEISNKERGVFNVMMCGVRFQSLGRFSLLGKTLYRGATSLDNPSPQRCFKFSSIRQDLYRRKL